jgi:ketosteroid isomerase-like protein
MQNLSKLSALFLAITTTSIFAATVEVENKALEEVRALAEAEKAFAQTSADHGIRESFLKFFADDGVVFAPEPKNAKKFYTQYQDKGRRLIWQPIFATLAASGELGVTTGPWEMQKSFSDKTPVAFGQFLSVWKKQPDKSWKVIVDGGIENPQPSEELGELQLVPPLAKQPGDGDPAQRNLDQAEETLSQTLIEGAGAALIASASEDVRVLRDNALPAVGKTAAKLMLSSDNGKMTRKKSGAGISASSDLAYRYGSYLSVKPNVTERGFFFTIWHNEAGNWRILIDLEKKVEAPAEKKL